MAAAAEEQQRLAVAAAAAAAQQQQQQQTDAYFQLKQLQVIFLEIYFHFLIKL